MVGLSEAGLTLIKTFEGYEPLVYKDEAGYPDDRLRHKLLPGESYPNGITEGLATALLLKDVASAVTAVNRLVKVTLTQGQFDALLDFEYNLGQGTLERSTLLADLNAGKYAEAAAQFELWDHAGGEVVPGLLRRRQAEAKMFIA